MEKILENYKAIIFDMDGVIVNSLDFWKNTEKKMLLNFGIDKDLINYKITESMSTKEAINYWLNKYPQYDVTIEDIEEFVITEMMNLIQSNDCINEEIQSLIQELNAQSYLLGLATNSPKKIMEVVLEKSGLQSVFNAIVTADDVKQVKPNPEIYLETMKRLNIHQNECLVIEDSEYGIQAAKSAGIDVLLYQLGTFSNLT